jgi:hypothetical protein
MPLESYQNRKSPIDSFDQAKIFARVADDPSDLAYFLRQHKSRRYCNRPFKQYAGKRLISNVRPTQRRRLPFGRERVGRTDFDVPALTPSLWE